MSFDTAISAIESRAREMWPGLEPTVPLELENDDFQTPARPVPWISVRIEWNGGGFETIGSPGSNLARRQGHIWVYAFVPRKTGVVRAHQLAAKAAGMFEGQDFSGVVCEAAMPGGPASSEDGNYRGQSCAVPFNFDDAA